MTSLTNEYFEERNRISKEQSATADSWLIENNQTSLNQWLSENKYEFYDLVDREIVEFTSNNKGLSSLPEHIVSLSNLGTRFVGLIPTYKPDGDGDLFWTGFETEHAYVVDDTGLLSLLKSQNNRTRQERAKKYLHACEKYQITHRLPDNCLPFEERSYLTGPFCDTDSFPEKNGGQLDEIVFFCDWCGDYVRDKPKFLLKETLLCYKCCKLLCNRLESIAEDLNEISRRKVEETKRIHESWAYDMRYYLAHKPLSVKLAEFFGTSSASYYEELLQKYPEPHCNEYTPVSPAVSLVDNPFLEVPTTRQKILNRDKNLCQLCGIYHIAGGAFSLEVHHIVPKAKGGKDSPTNLIALCKQCHDHETWFGHTRAYKTTGEFDGFENQWEYDLIPELLHITKNELAKKSELFEPEADWVKKAKLQFLTTGTILHPAPSALIHPSY